MNSLATVIGYVVIIIGGISLALIGIWYLITAALSLPPFKKKVLRILHLGMKAYGAERHYRTKEDSKYEK